MSDSSSNGEARANRAVLVGILPGEGIGPEITAAAASVAAAALEADGIRLVTETGGAIGGPAEECHGAPLTSEVVHFCSSIFSRGGAVLAGAGGGRFVYDLREKFGLGIKLSPVFAWRELGDIRPVRVDGGGEIDFVIARENLEGAYQGEMSESPPEEGPVRRVLRVTQTDAVVAGFLGAAASLAARRRGRLAVVHKAGGLPELAASWRSLGADAAAGAGVEWEFLDIDYASYLLIREPGRFDVVAAPNCFGDILSDLGGLLMGSRGLTFGGSFGNHGEAVYQTNHGAAYDLAGTDAANPLGQILSAAMMLRESFHLESAATRIESAVRRTLGDGWRTRDLAAPGCRTIGTGEMTARVIDRLSAGGNRLSAGGDHVSAG